MGIGGGSQRQSSSGSSSQFGTNTSYGSALNLGQEQQFQNLWAQAGAMNNSGAQQGLGYNAYNQAQGLNQAGANALGGANMAGAFGTLNRLQNPGMDPMMGAYAQQVGQQFNEQIMPQLRGDAMVAGGFGGSRAGIAQGVAAGQAQRNIQNFGAQLYGQNQDRAMQAAQLAGGLAGQQAQAYGQLGNNALAGGQFGMGVPWYNLQQYAGLLGNPIMEDLGGTSWQEGMSDQSSSGRGSNFRFSL
jgi:hypothetical protein